MKLANVLSAVNQIEKSKFINFLDRVCTEASEQDEKLAKRIRNIDGQIKDAPSSEVTQLFKLALPLLTKEMNRLIALCGAQAALLVNILRSEEHTSELQSR